MKSDRKKEAKHLSLTITKLPVNIKVTKIYSEVISKYIFLFVNKLTHVFFFIINFSKVGFVCPQHMYRLVDKEHANVLVLHLIQITFKISQSLRYVVRSFLKGRAKQAKRSRKYMNSQRLTPECPVRSVSQPDVYLAFK